MRTKRAIARGTLSGTTVSGTPSVSQGWALDALGNWTGATTDGTTQTRAANFQNQYTAVGGATTPVYDAAGEMTGDETGKGFTYDAWGRLVGVKSAAGATLEAFGYDGLGRRITTTAGGVTTQSVYSAGWQVLEQIAGGVVTTRYVWSPVYVDALVMRDRDTSGTGLTATGTPGERLYAVADANWNVVAVVGTDGLVKERYAYDPFGAVTVESPTYAVLSASGYAWTVGWQGMAYDSVSGLSYQRERWYSPTLGRWATTDLTMFGAGDNNLYRYVHNCPVNFNDPTGLWSQIGADAGFVSGALTGGAFGTVTGVVLIVVVPSPFWFLYPETGFLVGGLCGGFIGYVTGGLAADPATPVATQVSDGYLYGGVAAGILTGGALGGLIAWAVWK